MSEKSKTGMKILYKHPLLTILEYENQVYMRTYDFLRKREEFVRIDDYEGTIHVYNENQDNSIDIDTLEKLFLELENEN